MRNIYRRILNVVLLIVFMLNYIFVLDSYPIKTKIKHPREFQISLSVDDISFRSATFNWTYPEELSFDMGDYLNLILIDEKMGDLGQAPIFTTYHNKDGKSLSDTVNFKINSLYPKRKYKVILELVKFDGNVYKVEESFSTSNFEISNMKIEGSEEDVIGNKNITVTWETNPSDVSFLEGDKVEIYAKTLSDNDFFKDVIFESTESVKSANITLPNFQESYDFKISYLIGGNRIESDLFFVNLLLKDPTFQVGEIKSSSAKFTWDFPNVDILGEKSAIKIFLKEAYNLDYAKDAILSIEGKEKMVETKEYIAKNLKFGTKYNVKVQLISDTITRFEKEKPIMTEKEYEFTTAGFDITDLKATSGNTNVVKVTWNFNEENISFSEGDKLSAYIKESMADQYSSENLLKDTTLSPEEMMKKKELDVTLPNYDTKYDIKLVYTIGGKNLYNYVSHTITLPKIDFGVQVLTEDSFKIKLSFDKDKTKFKESDKIELFMREHKTEENGEQGEYKSITFTPGDYTEEPQAVPGVAGVGAPAASTDSSSSPSTSGDDQSDVEGQQNAQDNHYSFISVNNSSENTQSLGKIIRESEPDGGAESGGGSAGGTDQGGSSGSEGNVENGNKIEKQLKVESVKSIISPEVATLEDAPKTYDLKIKVTKDNDVFQEEIFKVNMTKDNLQIVGIDYEKIDEKKVTAKVDYAPFNYKFKEGDTLSYTKGDTTDGAKELNKSKITIPKAILKENSGTNTITKPSSNGGMDNKFEIPFDKFDKYTLKFEYKINGSKEEEEAAEKDELSSKFNLKFGSRKISKKTAVSTSQTQATSITYEDIYDNKFDVFDLEVRDVIFNQIKLGLGFKPYYKPKNGDKVEIFFKTEKKDVSPSPDASKDSSGDGFSSEPLVTFIHDGDKVDLLKINVIDLAGLDAGSKYTFKAKFTPKEYSGSIIEKVKEVTTSDLVINEVKAKHLTDLAVDITWALESGFNFGANDTLDVFYKKGDESYKEEPNDSFKDIHLSDGATVYLDVIDTTYKIKCVFKSGHTSVEKEIEVSNTVEDILAEVYKVYETSAYIKWDYPSNYNITDGESISIFLKTKGEEYGEEPDYYMEHNDKDNEYLIDFKSVKLTDIMPDTEYDVKVLLDFGDIGKKEKELHFKTNPIVIEDIGIMDLTPYECSIKWSLNSKTIDFNPEYDSLKVYVKSKDVEEFTEDNIVYKVSNGMDSYKNFRVLYDEDLPYYDVKVEYDFVQKKIDKVLDGGVLSLWIGEDGYLNVNYPSSLKFSNGDKIEFLKRSQDESDYSEVSYIDSDFGENNLFDLSNIPSGSSLLVLTKNSSSNVFPAEMPYGEADMPVTEIVSELTGNWVDVTIPDGYNVDTSSEVLNSIGGESYFAQTEDGEDLIVIDKLVPRKVYEDVFVLTYDLDGNEVRFGLDNFTLEPATLLEDFLYNSYYFAFDREPDEGGYNYWKYALEEKKDITGKFFLINLMFAEREFADRNLSDEELIKVLYQIVVNREYDEQGLNYWIGVYREYLNEFNGDKYEAKKKIVLRMAYEPEFRNLCERMDIIW